MGASLCSRTALALAALLVLAGCGGGGGAGGSGLVPTPSEVPLAQPAGLVAQTDGIGPRANVSLAWEPIASADQYIVMRGSQQVGEIGTVAIVDRNLGIGVHTYSVAGLISSPIRVIGSSSAVAVTVAPAKPAGLQATSTGTGQTGDIVLTWASVEGAAGYRIYLGGAEVADVSGLSHAHEDPGPGAYAFRVAAYANGVTSQPSDTVRSGIVPADPPSSLTATPTGFGAAAEVALAWNPVDGAQGYRIYRDGVEIASDSGTSYTDSTPGPGSYIYQFAAYNIGGQTQPSMPVNVQINLMFSGVQDANGNYEEVVLAAPAPSDGVDYEADPEFLHVLGDANAQQAYQRGYFGQGVTVAIVDIQFSRDWQETADNMLPPIHTGGTSRIVPNTLGHGSWVASALGGVKNSVGIHGIAPSVTMQPYQLAGLASETVAFKHAVSLNIPIINNSYGYPIAVYGQMITRQATVTVMLEVPVGPELLAHPSCTRCKEKLLPLFKDYASIARDKDVVFVWAAGNERWSSNYAYIEGKMLEPSLGGKYDILDEYVSYLVSDIIHGFTILPIAVYEVEPSFSDPIVLATLDYPMNSIADSSAGPSFEPSLLGKWVAVIGVSSLDGITYNGCGSAKYYCMAARDATLNDMGRDVFGTSFAAPQVSGALALLRNRFPDMPMHAILAIIFHTARDRGEPGIDELYGRGVLDVGAAVTVQGTVAVVLDEPGTDRRTREHVAQTRLRLPAALSRLALRAQGVSVAVDYLGGNYYDMPLSGLFKEPESWLPPLGQAAANMLTEPDMQQLGSGFAAAADLSSGELLRAAHTGPFWKLSYDKCRDCAASGWREYRSARIAAPFFDAGGEAAIGEIGLGSGWSAFAAAGFAKQLDDMRYRQMGARWQAKPAGSESWAAQLELSRSDESNALLGGEYSGALAVGDASTYQARILGELALGADWTLAGSYLAGWTEGESREGSMISAIGDIRFAGWRAYLEGRSLLYAEDTMRIGLVRQAAVSGGSLSIRRGVVDGDPTFSDEHYMNTNTQYSVAETVLELDQPGVLVAQFGYAITPRPGMRAALGLERANGSAGDHDTAASFELRWDL